MERKSYEHAIDIIKHWKNVAKRNLEKTPNDDLAERCYHRGEIGFAELVLIILGEEE